MAFCPNCGTPNTDQAAKCVSCAFELAPAQKAKFKGTIMMSGVQTPQAPQAPQPQPAPAPAASPAAAPTPAASPQSSGRNMAFEKTMLGPMAGVAPISAPPADPQGDLARAATVESPAPQFTPPPAAAGNAAAAASAPAASPGAGYAGTGYSHTGNFGGDDDDPPTLPKPNTGKVLAIGGAVVLVVTCLIVVVMLFMIRGSQSSKGGSDQADDTALAWRGTLSQALTQVSAICATNCDSAATYFHPSVQATLLGQAKQLTPARLQKLVDPEQSEAAMLNGTDDGSLATNLGLDPQLCVRVASGSAKAIGCSVPNPSGAADMRIVHLSGLDSL